MTRSINAMASASLDLKLLLASPVDIGEIHGLLHGRAVNALFRHQPVRRRDESLAVAELALGVSATRSALKWRVSADSCSAGEVH
jgi:hypothetical protein